MSENSKYKRFRITVHSVSTDTFTDVFYEYHKSKDHAIEAHRHNVVLVEEVEG